MSRYTITVTARGTGDVVHFEEFQGTLLGAEKRQGANWDNFCMAPGRYRSVLGTACGAVVSTIE